MGRGKILKVEPNFNLWASLVTCSCFHLSLTAKHYSCCYHVYYYLWSVHLEPGDVLGGLTCITVFNLHNTSGSQVLLPALYPGSETLSLRSSVTQPVRQSWKRDNDCFECSMASLPSTEAIMIMQESLGHLVQWVHSIFVWVSLWNQFPPSLIKKTGSLKAISARGKRKLKDGLGWKCGKWSHCSKIKIVLLRMYSSTFRYGCVCPWGTGNRLRHTLWIPQFTHGVSWCAI